MTKINCMVLGFSLGSFSLGAMDKSYWMLEQRLMVGRRLESMQPDKSRELQLWQRNNMLELEIERQRNMKLLEFEQKRLSHAMVMDRKTWTQRYGISRDATRQEIETYEDEMRHL